MGVKLRSGFYLGKKSSGLLALLLATLLLALLVLGILYGRCAHGLQDARLRQNAEARPPPPCASGSPNASAAPPARPPGPWDEWRLPAHLAPAHYSLLLWPHLAPGLPEPRTHSGRVNITVRCRQATATVLLHSADLTYRSAAVWGPGANGSRRSVPVAELWPAPQNEYVVLELRENLSAGALYEVQLAFQGTILGPHEYDGLFLNTYEDEGESRQLIASQLAPTGARRVYPCFDEPALKATFSISIVHHPSYVALSNMPAIDVSEYQDVNESTASGWINETADINLTTGINWTVTTYETSPKMSTYITAFVVCNFDHVTRTERGKKIRIWARKTAVQNGLVDYALNISGPVFSFMEDLFDISYTLAKTDFIALPHMTSSAMENWGLITFQEENLLYPLQDTSRKWKKMILHAISHEIVHQWFGNLVTMAWWNELWLNEGFATYFGYLGEHYIDSTEPLDQVFSYKIVLAVMPSDAHMYQALSDRDEKRQSATLSRLFSQVTYQKGAAIVRMLSNFLTERLFIKALSSYLNAFAFSNTIQDDLWNHIQKVIDEENDLQLPAPVKVIMDSWTCQAGFPLLTANFSSGKISQETFYVRKGKSSANNTWIIPISWMRNGTMQPLVWLDSSSKIFSEMEITDSEHDWIILNVNMIGYYRINYEETYWRKIAKWLEKDPKVIPAVNRLQLMEDAFQLMRAGYTAYDTPLYLTKYLGKEDDLIVWKVVLNHLEAGSWKVIQSDNELYPVLKKYFLPRISPIYHQYEDLLRQNLDVLTDDYSPIFLIETILETACWIGLQECLDLASEIFTKWMNNSSLEVSACLSKTICCYGVQQGSDKEWDFVWKMFKQNNAGLMVKYNMFSALSCTREPWLLQRFLQFILNDFAISPQYGNKAIEDVASSEAGREIAWTFFRENWLHLYNRDVFGTVNALSSFASTDIDFQMLQDFINNTVEPKRREHASFKMTLEANANKKEKESVTKMIKWLKKNMDD
uniref:Aminopeptidase n=1 Tax=Varanus komodoensis TaxID=61221 RepID=A0A8D2Q6D6_VARKO